MRAREDERAIRNEPREDARVEAEAPAPATPQAPAARLSKRMTSSISGRFTMDTSRTVAVGMRVHIIAGTFEGQSGVVKELDGKGAARVAVGRVIAEVRVEDLAAARSPSTRPALSSSHRKITPSGK